MRGTVVYSCAGRDKGSFLIEVGQKDGLILVCDGKYRPLERPKPKNKKHLRFTDYTLKEEQFTANRVLRKSLKQFYKAE